MKYKVIKKQNNSCDCIVCGLNNNSSVKTQFYELSNKTVVGFFVGGEEHQSYNNRMHGGIITGILDEVIGRAIQIDYPEVWAVTGEIKVRFKKPVPLGVLLKAVGKVTENSSKIFKGTGFIEDEAGNMLATASATYVKLNIDTIVEGGMNEKDWFLSPLKQDPKTVEINNMQVLDSIS